MLVQRLAIPLFVSRILLIMIDLLRITREYESKELNKSFNSLKQQCLERYTND